MFTLTFEELEFFQLFPTFKFLFYAIENCHIQPNNLFERAKIMDISSGETAFSETTREVLNDVSKLCTLLEKESYGGNTGKQIIQLLTKYLVQEPFKRENYFIINQIREKLYSINRAGEIVLKAKGKSEWLGFVEFTKVKTNDMAVINTARVLDAVDADVVCTVEVDNRIALRNFNELIKRNFRKSYAHYMLIDGNDDRGIDVGILSKYEITSISSHVDDEYTTEKGKQFKIFSRDCAEYTIKLRQHKQLHLLCNHFKSKGYGTPAVSNERRKRQAERVAKILKSYDLKKDFVVVAGDFNDTPDSLPLQGLLQVHDLHDVLGSDKFQGERWTYHVGSQQFDYLLVSNSLFQKLSSVGIERRGIFKKRGLEHFAEVDSKVTQASDHACVWATFDLS